MLFVGNLILNTSCTFYYDSFTVTSFISIKYGNFGFKILL